MRGVGSIINGQTISVSILKVFNIDKHGLPQDSSGRTRYIPSRWHPSPEIGYNVEKGYPEHYHGKRAGNNEKYWVRNSLSFLVVQYLTVK